MYELPKNRMVPSRNVLFAAPRGGCRKCEAAFVASREYVTVQRLKGLKFAVVCYFPSRIFNPTNLLNYVASCIELMMQI